MRMALTALIVGGIAATKNSQRQLSQLRITPPVTGPRIG
jgi:hypothetical protein